MWTDRGTALTDAALKKFLPDNNIELYHVFNASKAWVAARFKRTLCDAIAKYSSGKIRKIALACCRTSTMHIKTASQLNKNDTVDASNAGNWDVIITKIYGNFRTQLLYI